MNVDAEYWLSLAAQWIQSKSQTQMSFPQNFPMFPMALEPEPPKISNNHSDATKNDNLVETDMDLEEEKEDEPPSEDWNNWQTKIVPTTTIQNIISQQTLPTDSTQLQAPKLPTNHKNQSNRTDQFTSKFVQIPSAPIIGQISESSQSVDMVLDSEEEDDNNSAIMEAQKRKKLPVWIREGLERMEREKKQEALRLQKEKELQQDVENRKKIMEEALKEIEREKTAKSKYDSDSDDNDEQQRNGTPETEHNLIESSRLPDVQDDEDAFEKMMLLVRKTLTEILLEVTDEKIQEISSETLSKYRRKASSVTSNRTVTNSLGLGVYANSSEDESDDEDNVKDDQSDWESEAVLRERIRAKSIMFEQRAKEIKERLAKVAEAEQERFRKKDLDIHDHSKLKSRYDSDDDIPQIPKSRKIDGEEKFDQIYSISSFYATGGRQRDKKKTRFNDPKERTSSVLVTHVGMLDKMKPAPDNGSTSIIPQILLPSPEVKKKSRKRDSSSSSASSSSSGRQKKHKKHKKSSKHSKKSSKKRDRSRSRDYDKDRRKSYKSDRHSIESRSSVRSSDSKRNRSRSRSRSRHRSRRY